MVAFLPSASIACSVAVLVRSRCGQFHLALAIFCQLRMLKCVWKYICTWIKMISAPHSASATAAACPIPLVPPVTSAVWPSRENMFRVAEVMLFLFSVLPELWSCSSLGWNHSAERLNRTSTSSAGPHRFHQNDVRLLFLQSPPMEEIPAPGGQNSHIQPPGRGVVVGQEALSTDDVAVRARSPNISSVT